MDGGMTMGSGKKGINRNEQVAKVSEGCEGLGVVTKPHIDR